MKKNIIFYTLTILFVCFAQPNFQAQPLTGVDTGNPSLAGSTTANSSDNYTIKGSGATIGKPTDQLHFAYIPASGDFEISARIDAVSGGSPYWNFYGTPQSFLGQYDQPTHLDKIRTQRQYL